LTAHNQERANSYQDKAITISSEFIKVLVGLNLGLFGGATALLSTVTGETVAAGCYLAAMVLTAISIASSMVHLQMIAKKLFAISAEVDGATAVPDPFGSMIPTGDRKKALDSYLSRTYSWAVHSILLGSLLIALGIGVHHSAAALGAFKLWVLWSLLLIGLGISFAGGYCLGRRKERGFAQRSSPHSSKK
jgi:hypothetical protein